MWFIDEHRKHSTGGCAPRPGRTLGWRRAAGHPHSNAICTGWEEPEDPSPLLLHTSPRGPRPPDPSQGSARGSTPHVPAPRDSLIGLPALLSFITEIQLPVHLPSHFCESRSGAALCCFHQYSPVSPAALLVSGGPTLTSLTTRATVGMRGEHREPREGFAKHAPGECPGGLMASRQVWGLEWERVQLVHTRPRAVLAPWQSG